MNDGVFIERRRISPVARLSLLATVIAAMGTLALLVVACVYIYWAAFDRVPPVRVLEVRGHPSGHPGDPVKVTARVVRDIDRGCQVSYSRFFFDAGGARHEIPGAQDILLTAPALAAFERRSPGLSVVPFIIPAAAEPGLGDLMSVFTYVCNPAHWLFPIIRVSHVPVQVLDPLP